MKILSNKNFYSLQSENRKTRRINQLQSEIIQYQDEIIECFKLIDDLNKLIEPEYIGVEAAIYDYNIGRTFSKLLIDKLNRMKRLNYPMEMHTLKIQLIIMDHINHLSIRIKNQVSTISQYHGILRN
jgi:hypothetical protein